MRTRTNRAVAVATAAALALTSFGIAPAVAASKPAKQVETQRATDFSSHRRYYGRHRDAAIAAAIIGAIGAYAAAREYRKAHRHGYYAPYANGYYGNGYNGAPNYGPRHYRYW